MTFRPRIRAVATAALLASPTGAARAASVQDGLQSLEAHFEARLDVVHDDDGLRRDAAYEPTTVTDVYQGDVKLRFGGRAGERTTFAVTLDPVAESLVETAVVEWTATPTLRVRAGRDRVAAGGWDQRTWGVDTLLVNPYVQAQMPWIKARTPDQRTGPATAPVLAVVGEAPGLGTATVQALDDVVVGEDEAARFSHSHRQPALLVELLGAPGLVRPLVQLGTYDLNHSALWTLGAELRSGGLTARADVTVDYRRQPVPGGRSATFTVYRAATADVAYDVQSFGAFAKLEAMEVKQPSIDHRGNQPGILFDDDALDALVGVRYALDGEAFRPFLAVVRRSGRFLAEAADPTGPVTVKAELAVDLGVTSRF